jgi:solute carrier family 25 (mitochondrial phosphate transporter), member 3
MMNICDVFNASCRYWKKKFVEVSGSQEKAIQYRTAIYLGASTVAE